MCVEYKDLKRVYPKDDFSLPYIDLLVNNTVEHTLLSFMDGFLRYNLVKMALEDKKKTLSIIHWGILCYNVIPFGLKKMLLQLIKRWLSHFFMI